MHRSCRTATAVAAALCALTAAAQETQRIEITGSAIKRIDREQALPVTVITRDDIARSGATTAADLLDRLPLSNGQGYNVGIAIGDGARPGFAGASLRGLGSNTTLILLNGRRLAVFAFDGGGVDLNSIALGAIERVEVLRDGASALYGSDAIAGVINFITRSDYRGLELGATAKVPEASGGKSSQATATVGFGDLSKDRFNVFGSLSVDRIDGLKASQRKFAATSYLPNAPGGAFDRTSGNTLPASVQTPVGVLNPGVATGCLPPSSFQTAPTGACRFDYASVIDIIAPQEKESGLLRGSFQFTPSHGAFAEYNSTKTKSTFRISPTPASSATTFFGDDVLYPAGGKWYPKAINPATGQLENGILNHLDGSNSFVPLSGDLPIFWRTLDAGPRTNEPTAKQDRVVLGLRGAFADWDYDLAYLKSRSRVTERYTEGQLFESKLLNATCIDPVTNQPVTPCGPLTPGYQVGTLNPLINPFGLNDAAGLAAIREALVLGPVRISKSERSGVDGKITGQLGQLAGGAIGVAIGAEHRKETFDDQPLAVLGAGDIIGGGGNQAPVVGSRDVTAVFAEASFPVVKGLELIGQVRHDKYSDFGNTTNPKLGLRWQPNPQWLVRASVGTGFRAPTLPDLLAQVTQTNTGDNYNDPFYEAKVGDCYDTNGNPTPVNTPQYCNAQLTVKQGGNSSLRPEKSRQASLGLVFQPTRDVSIGVDIWRIKIKDQIVTPDPDARLAAFIGQFLADPNAAYDPTTAKLTPAGKAALIANATGVGINIDAGSGFLDFVASQLDNVSTVATTGIDIGIKAVLARGPLGEFSAGIESSYIDSQKQDGVELVGTYAQFGPVVRWKHAAALDWKRGPWSAGVLYNQSSSYRDQGDTRTVGAWETVDLTVAYTGIRNLTLRAGIVNLLDRDPPYSRQGDYFHVGYDPTIADPRGRTYTLGINYKFF
jgi:iron complex outermembrane recepter protein